VSFAAFDILDENYNWLPPAMMYGACQALDIPVVPIVEMQYEDWTWDELFALADRRTAVTGANHIAEGVVIRPLEERRDPKFGRVQLKIVSNAYLEKKG
jgi:hypothetical protein